MRIIKIKGIMVDHDPALIWQLFINVDHIKLIYDYSFKGTMIELTDSRLILVEEDIPTLLRLIKG